MQWSNHALRPTNSCLVKEIEGDLQDSLNLYAIDSSNPIDSLIQGMYPSPMMDCIVIGFPRLSTNDVLVLHSQRHGSLMFGTSAVVENGKAFVGR